MLFEVVLLNERYSTQVSKMSFAMLFQIPAFSLSQEDPRILDESNHLFYSSSYGP